MNVHTLATPFSVRDGLFNPCLMLSKNPYG